MKKNYWIFAAAAVALAACSNDDTITVNQGIEEANTIGFNTIVEGQTRASGITSGNLLSFYVTANRGDEIYFGGTPVQFAKDNTTDPVSYRSETKYYWPSEGKLDFYAFAPATGATITRNDSTTFSVTPAAAPASQEDFVYGVVRQQDKTTGGQGVQLNFRHAMSNVIIQLKNSSADKSVTVADVAIGYIMPTGTFHPVFKTAEGNQIGFCTDGTDISNVTAASETGFYIVPGAWATSGDDDDRISYTQTATTTAYAANTTTATALPADMILVPQTLVYPGAYSAATAGSGYDGACITVQLKIQDAQGHYLAGTANNPVTAMWPLAATQWLPGHKYTYTLDLAGGGYYTTNQDNDADLDPILENQEIFFLTPTVAEWIAAPGIDVNNNN